MKLSVVMPVYNEQATLRRVVERVLSVGLDIELLCVDDGSRDGSREILADLQKQWPQIKVIPPAAQHGQRALLSAAASRKPPATTSSFRTPTSNTIPATTPCCSARSKVVRLTLFMVHVFWVAAPHRVLYFWHSVGNWVLTLLSNMITNLNMTDMETCYKVFRREVIQSIPLEEDRFGFEPEVTVKIAKRQLARLRSGDQLLGTYLRGGQEDRLERRLSRAVVSGEVRR